MAIGELIQKLREDKGWTLDELVKHSGVCRSTLQRVEYHGRSTLTVNTIRKLAKALGVEPGVIFRELD